jgi:cytochrome c biogenesis protein CcmG, thiol:disulfide interchange protein DsbE
LERDFGIVTDPFPDWSRSDDRIVTARPAPWRSCAAVALLAAGLALALAGCGGERPASTKGGGAPQPLGSQPLVERDAEQFTADLGRLQGRVVVVNFWASWCVPCRTEMPDFQRVSREFEGQPVTFVGVDASDERAAAARLLSRSGVTYPTVFDRQGIYGGIASRWSVTGLPQTWFVAKDGSRSLRVPRQISAAELRANVKRLLEQG